MAERRLITAMEAEIAARIATVEQSAAEAIRQIEAAADRTIAEAELQERQRSEQRLRDYERGQRLRRENEWQARLRNLQFEVAEQVFRELEQLAAAARDRADYGAIWARLLDEAMSVYGHERADPPNLRVAAADRTLAAGRSRDVASVEADDAIGDGLELVSPDRRLRVRNTLRSRLRQGRERFLKDISDALREHFRR